MYTLQVTAFELETAQFLVARVSSRVTTFSLQSLVLMELGTNNYIKVYRVEIKIYFK